MARQLCIVSRQHPDLYAYLRQRFADDETVEVILDRRSAERRGRPVPVGRNRRVVDRRSRPDIDERLRKNSHVIVTIEGPGSAE
ncbi:MAG: hypothetical protein ACRDQ2_17010 [Gaiellales bacterium]